MNNQHIDSCLVILSVCLSGAELLSCVWPTLSWRSEVGNSEVSCPCISAGGQKQLQWIQSADEGSKLPQVTTSYKTQWRVSNLSSYEEFQPNTVLLYLTIRVDTDNF